MGQLSRVNGVFRGFSGNRIARSIFKFCTLLIPLVALHETPAQAGIFELGAQANYRKTNYDATHSEEMETGTASLAYYFWDLSALEFSYTRGAGDQLDPQYKAYQNLTAYGIDMLFTLANKESSFKPYLKVGAAWVDKNLQYYINPNPPFGVETTGVAPTLGLGVKIMMTQQVAIKFGIDVSTSPIFLYTKNLNPPPDPGTTVPTDPITYDVSANAGISFLF